MLADRVMHVPVFRSRPWTKKIEDGCTNLQMRLTSSPDLSAEVGAATQVSTRHLAHFHTVIMCLTVSKQDLNGLGLSRAKIPGSKELARLDLLGQVVAEAGWQLLYHIEMVKLLARQLRS